MALILRLARQRSAVSRPSRMASTTSGARKAGQGVERRSIARRGGVDVLLASCQNEALGSCSSAGEDVHLGAFWVRAGSPSGKARTSPFTVAVSTATHRRSWQWHSPQNSRRLRVSGGHQACECACRRCRERMAYRLRDCVPPSARAPVARTARDYCRHARLYGTRADWPDEPLD